MKFETLAIRIQNKKTPYNEHSTPIFPTSSFVFDDSEAMRSAFAEEVDANIYSRYSNPSVAEFETKMASLELGEAAIGTASGMAAIFTTFACNLKQGDHVLLSQSVFGSTIKLFENFFNKWGIEHDLIKGSDINKWQASIKPNSKLVFIETPSNPGLEILDISSLASLCKKENLIFVVDNCFATPYLQNPLQLGADIVVHSATKYIDGQGRVLGGVIVGNEEHMSKIVPFIRNAGPTLSPFNAWILSKSLETLAVRMDRHCENALALANYLSLHPNVAYVNYPFLRGYKNEALARSQMKAGGGIVSFELKGGLKQGINMIDRIRMMSITPNLGDTRSIITHPASSTHSKLTSNQRIDAGVTDGLIRISVGLEHIADILEDVDQSLK